MHKELVMKMSFNCQATEADFNESQKPFLETTLLKRLQQLTIFFFWISQFKRDVIVSELCFMVVYFTLFSSSSIHFFPLSPLLYFKVKLGTRTS